MPGSYLYADVYRGMVIGGLTLPEKSNSKTYRFYGWENADIMDDKGMTPRDYYDLLSNIWTAETSAPRFRGEWSPENRTLGQC